MEPRWRCRICSSADLLGTTHTHCPNCSHERDYEELVEDLLDDFLSLDGSVQHRFSGSSYRCCGQGWSLQARYCGQCGERLQAPGAMAPDDDHELGTTLIEESTMEPVAVREPPPTTSPPWEWAPAEPEPVVQAEPVPAKPPEASMLERARTLLGSFWGAP